MSHHFDEPTSGYLFCKQYDYIWYTSQILKNYLLDKQLSKSEIIELNSVVQKEITDVRTLNDIIESQIIDLLKLGFDFSIEDENINFKLKSTIFISEDTAISLYDELVERINALLDCYNGRKCLWVNIRFKDGNGSILIQV